LGIKLYRASAVIGGILLYLLYEPGILEKRKKSQAKTSDSRPFSSVGVHTRIYLLYEPGCHKGSVYNVDKRTNNKNQLVAS
jgi:hypothetical protein